MKRDKHVVCKRGYGRHEQKGGHSLPGRKEGLEFVRVRVMGASLWRSESVLFLWGGAVETDSERATPFFFKAGFSGTFSELGGGFVKEARFGRLVFCVSGSGGMKGGLWPLGGDPTDWGSACFSLGQESVWLTGT